MSRAFRVGDRVVLDPMKVDQEELFMYGCMGELGHEYIIEDIEVGDLLFEGSNWHKAKWCTMAKRDKNVIGGELVCVG